MKLFQSLLPLALLLPNLWGQSSFTSGGAIVVSNTIKASPYPTSGACTSNNACVDVTGLTGTIQNVSVTLSNVTLTGTPNVAIMLESPGGGKLDILSNVCRGSGTQTFTLTDQAATSAVPGPATNCITTGSWKPTNNHFTGFSADNFPSPGPGTTGYTRSDPDSLGTGVVTVNTGTFGNVFAAASVNATPNGTWKLWVTNQAASGVTGQIGSWTVTVTTSTPTSPSNYCAPAGASTTTYTCTVTGLTTYYAGLVVPLKPDVTNTASSTLNVSTLGAKTIQKLSSGSLSNLSSGDLVAGVVYMARYNGTVFILDPGVGGSSGAGNGVNTQTGTTYTFVNGDCGKLVTGTNASSAAYSLPQAGAASAFLSGCVIDVQNRGAGTMTITPTTSTIDGAASFVLYATQGTRIFSDGSNYFTEDGAVNSSATLNVGGVSVTNTGAGLIKYYDSAGTYYSGWQGPTTPTVSVVYPFPDVVPSGNQYLRCGTPSGGVSTCTWQTVSGMDYASAATWTANGAASTPGAKWTGTPFSGTGTTAKALVLIEPTGTTAGTSWLSTGTALGINVPNGGGISPLDIKLDGSSVFSISQYGAITTGGNLTVGTDVVAKKFGVDYSGAASVSGCSAGTISAGSTAGTFVSGSTAACTFVVTMGASQSSAVGWNCWMNNQTTAYTAIAHVPRQTASSTTTATFSATTTSGDVMNWGCISR